MIRRTFFIFITVVLAIACNSYFDNDNLAQVENRTVDKKLEKARRWAELSVSLLDEPTKSKTKERTIESWSVVTSRPTKTDQGKQDTLLYVFNFADNEGFSIISAVPGTDPIIAVTESGHYDAEEQTSNNGFNFYMKGVLERLSLNNRLDPYYWYDTLYVGEVVDKNVGVTWGQGNIYGQYCPNGYSGCVTTAIAQIMAYHQQPSSFTTTCNMSPDYSNGSTVSLPWSQIKTHVKAHWTTHACNAVHSNIGALFREIGNQLSTIYYNNGQSSSEDTDVPDALMYFGYTGLHHNSVNVSIIKNSIKNLGPVYMGGDDATTGEGHAWVADGYKDYAYYYCRFEMAIDEITPVITQQTLLNEAHALHINWGWNGDCNGYFSFGIYDIDGADSYDGTHSSSGREYNTNMSMISICP